MGLADGCPWGRVHAGQFALAGGWGWRSQLGECSPQGLPALSQAQQSSCLFNKAKKAFLQQLPPGGVRATDRNRLPKGSDEFLGEIPTCNHSHAWLWPSGKTLAAAGRRPNLLIPLS